MAYTTIPTADIVVGKPVKKDLWQKTKDNLDDHESRISALASSANKIVVFDKYIDFADLGIGQIRSADLTLTEFQQQHGTEWILADGGSCVGTFYAGMTGHTTVPDATNRVLRGDGADAATLSTTQGDGFGSHNHGGGSHTHTVATASGGAGGVNGVDYSTGLSIPGTVTTSNSGTTINTEGISETRMKNVTVNHFIKVDAKIKDILKTREGMLLVGIKAYIIDINGLPTAGNLEFDIKKGSSRSALTSIFTTKPTLAWSGSIADGDATSSGSESGSAFTITSGDWLDLEITSIMTKTTGLYVQLFAEPS